MKERFMRGLWAMVAAFVFAGCGPRDSAKVLTNGEFDVPPKQFAYKKFTLDLGGTYTMTLTPKGGDLEAWVEPGEVGPIPLYSPNEKLPKAKIFADGKEDMVAGTLGWGGAHAVLFNRSEVTVRVKCRLTVVPTPIK
jgi:hypothetical protein